MWHFIVTVSHPYSRSPGWTLQPYRGFPASTHSVYQFVKSSQSTPTYQCLGVNVSTDNQRRRRPLNAVLEFWVFKRLKHSVWHIGGLGSTMQYQQIKAREKQESSGEGRGHFNPRLGRLDPTPGFSSRLCDLKQVPSPPGAHSSHTSRERTGVNGLGATSWPTLQQGCLKIFTINMSAVQPNFPGIFVIFSLTSVPRESTRFTVKDHVDS